MNKAILLGIATGMMAGPANAQEWRSTYTDIDFSDCITLAAKPGDSADLVPGWDCRRMEVRRVGNLDPHRVQ